MVRLVFRPYTHIWRTICTSVSLRASTRVSSGFALYRHSSPSFGYQHLCSHSNHSPKIVIGWWCASSSKRKGSHLSRPSLPLLSLRLQVFHPTTRIHVRLLGPCFKTGPMGAFSLKSIELNGANCHIVSTNTKKDFLEVQLCMPKHDKQFMHENSSS